MNGSNQNNTPPEYLRTGLGYGGYTARPDSRNRMPSLFPPPAGGPLDRREGDHDTMRLFGIRNPGGFFGIPRFPALPDFQLQPSLQGPDNRSKLSQEEQKKVLKMLKKEVYMPKLLRRKPKLYYRDNPITISRELEKEKDEKAKRCAICLEDFEPQEIVTVTPCKHMFHEECIVPWVKNEGRCPVCRFAICERFGETAAGSSNVTANDHFESDLIAIVRALEEAFVSENMRRFG